PVVSMGSASREDIVTSPMPIADTAGPELFDRTSTLHSPVLGISSPSDHFRHSDMQSLSPGHMSSAKRIENAFSSQRSVIVDQTRRMEELTRTLDEERTAKNRIQHQFTDYRESTETHMATLRSAMKEKEDSHKSTMDKLSMQNSSILAEKDTLAEKASKASQELDRLKRKMRLTDTEIDQLTERCETLQNENDELKQEQISKERTLATARSKIRTLEESERSYIVQLNNSKDEVKALNMKLQDSTSHFETSKTKLSHQVSSLRSELDKLMRENAAHVSEVSQLKREQSRTISSHAIAISTKSDELDQLKRQIEKEKEEREKIISDFNHQFDLLKEDKEATQQHITKFRKRESELSEQNETLHARIMDLEKERDAMEIDLKKIKTLHEVESGNLRTEIGRVSDVAKEKGTVLRDLERRLNNEKTLLEKENKRLQEELTRIRTQLARLKEERDKDREREEKKEQERKVEREKEDKEWKEREAKHKQRIDTLNARLTAESGHTATFREKSMHLAENSKAKDAEIIALREELVKASDAMDRLESEKQEQKDTLSEMLTEQTNIAQTERIRAKDVEDRFREDIE
ncbi:hypothetical protein ADUPG1_011315, partial [Aduncisulcus paluster]